MCWAGIESRQTAALVLGGSLVVFGVSGALSPISSPAPAADVAAASKSAAVGGPSEATVANAAVSPSPTPAASSPRPVPAPRPVGLVTVAGVALPNRSLTPGSVFATATTARICVIGYSSSVRAVNDSLHAAVFARYGIPYPAPTGAYEVDHLIALELGGDNSIANLWPEPAESRCRLPPQGPAREPPARLGLRRAAAAADGATGNRRKLGGRRALHIGDGPIAGHPGCEVRDHPTRPSGRVLRELHRRAGRRCHPTADRAPGIPLGSGPRR